MQLETSPFANSFESSNTDLPARPLPLQLVVGVCDDLGMAMETLMSQLRLGVVVVAYF